MPTQKEDAGGPMHEGTIHERCAALRLLPVTLLDSLTAADMNAEELTHVLVEAFPYITYFQGKTIVIKLGGSAREEERGVLEDVAWLRKLRVNPVVVHGGGPTINGWLKRLDIPSRFEHGLRVTSAEAIDVIKMALIGGVNQDLVALVNTMGVRAIGLSGIDGQMIQCDFNREYGDIGFVGEVRGVDPTPIHRLTEAGYIPIIAPIGYGPNGEAMNINADTAAADVAVALRAEKMIFLTDIVGILDQRQQLIERVDIQALEGLIEDGVVSGGMIPKVKACVRAMAGVQQTHIIDGRVPHALIRELFTDRGVGTMIAHGSRL